MEAARGGSGLPTGLSLGPDGADKARREVRVRCGDDEEDGAGLTAKEDAGRLPRRPGGSGEASRAPFLLRLSRHGSQGSGTTVAGDFGVPLLSYIDGARMEHRCT